MAAALWINNDHGVVFSCRQQPGSRDWHTVAHSIIDKCCCNVTVATYGDLPQGKASDAAKSVCMRDAPHRDLIVDPIKGQPTAVLPARPARSADQRARMVV